MSNPSDAAALVFSYHNWQSTREGGIHKLTEGLCKCGLDVDFVSFPRPYYHFLTRSELSGAKALCTLAGGRHYQVHGRTVYNFTCPTLEVPGTLRRLFPVPQSLCEKLRVTSFPSLTRRIEKRGRNYRTILFESNPCVQLYPRIRSRFGSAKIAYRPSDPLPVVPGTTQRDLDAERVLLAEADVVLLINEESRELYADVYQSADLAPPRVRVLPNGVDVEPFRRVWDKPPEFSGRPTAVYVGAAAISWALVLRSARNMTDVDFCIVTPNRPEPSLQRAVRLQRNLRFVPGIPPTEVPRYVTNCDVFIVPYAPEVDSRLVRLQAKLLKAMVARKPIVAVNLSAELEEHGIMVARNEDEFLSKLRQAVAMGPRTYPVDLGALSWDRIQHRFATFLGLEPDSRSMWGQGNSCD